jgi:hypothetical protein
MQLQAGDLQFQFVAPRKAKVLVTGRSSKQARAACATQGTRPEKQPAKGSRKACFASLTTAAMQPSSSGEAAAGERFHGSSSKVTGQNK